MKAILKLLPILMLFVLTSANAQKTVRTATIKTTINCDHCKQCETCGEKFQKTLLHEKGVQMVVLDEKAMTIKVTYNSKKTDLETVRLAISKLGYDADQIKADPIVYESLDSCCKK